MILKIGYETVDGKKEWDYFWNFRNLAIIPFDENVYFYDKDKDKVITKDGECNEIEVSPNLFTWYVNRYKLKNSMYFTQIIFTREETNTAERMLVLADNVFLMNDNGKTIDRF